MGMESKLYDEMVAEKAEGVEMAFDAGLDDMVFKPLVGPSPMKIIPGGVAWPDDAVTVLEKRVAELEHNMESMVALVEELLNERERFEATHWVKGRERSLTPDIKTA